MIFQWRANNGLPKNEDQVWDSLNNEWCSRAPSRCNGFEPLPSPVAGGGRRILRPLDYGAWVWQFLNTFGVSFRKDLFLAAITQAKEMLDPYASHGAGCSICADHFKGALAMFNMHRVMNPIDASVWVWSVHNLANSHAGHPYQSFQRMAVKYGWEPLDESAVLSIQQMLKTP